MSDGYQPATFEAGRQREVVHIFMWMLMKLENTEKTLQHTYRKHLPALQTAASE